MSNWNDDRLDKRDEELKEGFAEIRSEAKESFAQLDARFAKVDERFDKVDARFAKVDERFDKVDARFAKVDERLAEMATKKEMNEGFAEVRAQIDGLNRTLIAVAGAIIVALIGFHG